MIQEIYKTTKDVAVQKALEYLHKQSVPFKYTTTVPTTAHVPTGAIVVHDDGNGTKRLYVRTGKDNVGYITLT